MSKGTDARERESPFRELLVICFVTLILALGASIQSLRSNVNVLLFLPLDILFLLTMTRSYQLVLASQKKKTGEKTRPRDLPLHDRIIIALHFIGFFILIGLGIYFLHWIV
jgi:hypothetical protein